MTGKNKKNQEEIIHELRTRVKLEEYGVENVILKSKNINKIFYLFFFVLRPKALIIQVHTLNMMILGILISLKKTSKSKSKPIRQIKWKWNSI